MWFKRHRKAVKKMEKLATILKFLSECEPTVYQDLIVKSKSQRKEKETVTLTRENLNKYLATAKAEAIAQRDKEVAETTKDKETFAQVLGKSTEPTKEMTAAELNAFARDV